MWSMLDCGQQLSASEYELPDTATDYGFVSCMFGASSSYSDLKHVRIACDLIE
jgi:hypothetical protein